MSAFLLPNAGWGQLPNRVRHGRLVLIYIDILIYIYTYKRVVCVCLLVCLLVCLSAFYRPHDICPLCGAASEYYERAGAVAGGPACAAGKRMHSESTRARMPYNFSTKNRCADAIQNN